MSARDNVLKKLDETQLSGLLAAKKITPSEYQKFSTADDGTADLLAAVESLPKAKKAKPTKAAKPKLKKGRPCCEIEEVAGAAETLEDLQAMDTGNWPESPEEEGGEETE